MLTEEFTYTLPADCIARYPASERSASRLLALQRSSGVVSDHHFINLPSLLKAGDLLVLNNSKVLSARLRGYKETGGKIEVFIERIVSDNSAWALIRASKRPKLGMRLVLEREVHAQVQAFNAEAGLFLLSFNNNSSSIYAILDKYGAIPLPPYMDRDAEELDKERYQTVYAQHNGSVAAPTAGLHFTTDLLATLQTQGVEIAYLTLHVGIGTFLPVRVKNVLQHKMHAEHINVSAQLCDKIIATKQRGNRVVAVGTTTVRALESAAVNGVLQPYSGDTNIFIYPGFAFKVVDAMITNFHLPESSLLMLVSAFAGKDRVFAAYQYAIEQGYRFYSYGDAMLIADD